MDKIKFIPPVLKDLPNWGFGDLQKRPINAKTFTFNKPDTPSMWYDLDTVRNSLKNNIHKQDQLLGLGFCIFRNSNIVCIDIDHCINEDGSLNDIAKEICATFENTYQEYSQSGKGIHIFAKGTIPQNIKTQIEMYVDCHYMVFTGNTRNNKDVIDYSEQLQELYEKYKQKPEKEVQKVEKEVDMNNMYSIIDKIRSIPTEKMKFDKYFNGHCSIDSENTLGFASLLAFWTNKSHSMIKEIILNSGLSRDKCYRKTGNGDWLDLVIDKAIDGCTETYNPNTKNVYKENKKEIISGAKEIDVSTNTLFFDISDIPYTKKQKDRVYSGFNTLDKLIGGFTANCITLWTAHTNGGKTTLLSFLTQMFLKQGRKIFYFNGEQDLETFKNNLYLQYIGDKKKYESKVSKPALIDGVVYNPAITEWFVNDNYIEECKKMYDHKLFVFNNEEKHDIETLLIAMEQCYEHYGVRDFIIDNLMQIETVTDNEFREQKDITERIRAFAIEKHCNIHLIAHPRKTDGVRIGMNDIAGTMNIPNKAYNVISLMRIDKLDENSKEYLELKSLVKFDIKGLDCLLEVLKQKDGEGTGFVGLTYDRDTKTFKEASTI